jgi:hypothetical protein
MPAPDCESADCPNRRRAAGLEMELRAVYRLLEERREDLARCPKHPRGERCALPAGHEGGCKWGRGD